MENKLHFNIMLIVSLSAVIIMSFCTRGDIRYLAKNNSAKNKSIKHPGDTSTQTIHFNQQN
ncbi:MAG: hypothetical protein V4619_06145 [Bacteroidota bacterium]